MWFPRVSALTLVLVAASSAPGQTPIFSTTLDDSDSITLNPDAANGGVLAGAAPLFVPGAIGNAFQSTSSTPNQGSWARWNSTKVGNIFATWSNAAGITVDLYFQGTWTGLTGTVDEGLWTMTRRSGSGDLGDSYFITSLRTGKLRILWSNSSSTQYKFTFNGSAANPGSQEYAPGVDIPLTDGVIYRLTCSVGDGVFTLYLDDIAGAQYSNASPIFTDSTTMPDGFSWQLPPAGGTVQAREMNIGNRGPNFGGTLRAGDWVDNANVYNGVFSPAQIDAGPLLPIAVINADVSVGYVPLTVNFDGSASYDTGGTGGGGIVSYAWDFDNNGTVDDTSGALVSHQYTTVGNHVCKLTVTDNDNNTATGTFPIQVNTLPPAGLLRITAMQPSGTLAAGSHPLTSVTTQVPGGVQTFTADKNLVGPPDTAHVVVTGTGITGSGAGAATPEQAMVGLELGSTVAGLNADGKFLDGYFAEQYVIQPDGTGAPEIFVIESSNTPDNFQIQLLTNTVGAGIEVAATIQVRTFDYASTSTVIGGTGRGGVGLDLDALGVSNIRGVRLTGADGFGGGSGVDPVLIGAAAVPCPVPFADTDDDGDVDGNDFGVFQACYTGTSPPPGVFDAVRCSCFDRDENQMINEFDFSAFRHCMTRSEVDLDTENPPEGCIP